MVHFGLTFWLLKKKQDWGCNVSSIKKECWKWNWETIVPPESWTSVKLLTTCLQFPRILIWRLWQFLHKFFPVTNCAFTCMSCTCEQHFVYFKTCSIVSLFLSLQSWYSGWGPQSTSWTVSEVRAMQSRSSCIWNLHLLKSSLGNQKLQYTTASDQKLEARKALKQG